MQSASASAVCAIGEMNSEAGYGIPNTGSGGSTGPHYQQTFIWTDTNQQVMVENVTSQSLYIRVAGWEDPRGKY
jgi:hypothetical protein